MSRKTKKAGIVGKYGCRYGSTLRKTMKGIEESQHKKYICQSCGKNSVKREVIGIWKCLRCPFKFAGAAYAPTSISGRTCNTLIKSINKQK